MVIFQRIFNIRQNTAFIQSLVFIQYNCETQFVFYRWKWSFTVQKKVQLKIIELKNNFEILEDGLKEKENRFVVEKKTN